MKQHGLTEQWEWLSIENEALREKVRILTTLLRRALKSGVALSPEWITEASSILGPGGE